MPKRPHKTIVLTERDPAVISAQTGKLDELNLTALRQAIAEGDASYARGNVGTEPDLSTHRVKPNRPSRTRPRN